MHAAIVSIGDELVLGQTLDTNSAYLSDQFARLGIVTLCHQTVGDDLPSTRWAIEQAAARAELIIVTGGLGPTEDDLTRQALAEALNVPLVEDPASLNAIATYFTSRGRPMPARNAVQAMHPVGTAMIPNTCGTAPGIAAMLGQSQIFVLPGVPVEMRVMFEQAVVPRITAMTQAHRTTIASTIIHTLGWGESTVADRLGELMQRDRNPTVGTTVSDGIVSVRIRSQFADAQSARSQLESVEAEVHHRLHPIAFGRNDVTLGRAVIDLLIQRKQSLVTAESCTGGMVGAMLTEASGASAAYHGGWVTYTNAMKVSQLAVEQAILDADGAVSCATAEAMASGALARSGGCDLALAITGIAGPGGGSPDKPVGLVYIALADGQSVRSMRYQFTGSRQAIRERAARCALQMVRLHLLGEPLEQIHFGQAQPPA